MDAVPRSELEHIKFGPFTFTPVMRLLQISSGESKELSSELSSILHDLAAAKGQVVTKESLYKGICTRRNYRPEPKIIDVQICKLRDALDDLFLNGSNHVVTVWGKGYFLSDKPQSLEKTLQASRGTRNKGLLQRLSEAYLSAT